MDADNGVNGSYRDGDYGDGDTEIMRVVMGR